MPQLPRPSFLFDQASTMGTLRPQYGTYHGPLSSDWARAGLGCIYFAAAERRVTYLPGSLASRSMSISQRHPSLCWTERAAGNAAHLRARVAGPCASSAAAQGRTYIAYSSPYAVQLIVIGKRLIDSG